MSGSGLVAAIRAPMRIIERNAIGWKRTWWVILSGVVEPLIYLLGIGISMGDLVGPIEIDGRLVDYATFVAPGLMASAAMSGALFDTTFNFFFKLKFSRVFEGMLNTPLSLGDVVVGETAWAVLRGGIYSLFFVVVMLALGFVESAWFVFALPAALLLGWTFASFGTWMTTYVRTWTDFDLTTLITQPLFLASTTFFPLSVYPDWAEIIVVATPLYHGVTLIRDLSLGMVGLSDLGHVLYLLAMGGVCSMLTRRRLVGSLMS